MVNTVVKTLRHYRYSSKDSGKDSTVSKDSGKGTTNMYSSKSSGKDTRAWKKSLYSYLT